MNITRNTCRRPMKSDSHAHTNRPEPLAIEMVLTIPAATSGVTLLISCAIGDACEMIEMPAVVFRKRMLQSAYHCQELSASLSVYSFVARWFWPVVGGSHPAGL